MCLFKEVLVWFQHVLRGFCIFPACIPCSQRILGFSNTSHYQQSDVEGPSAQGGLKQTENLLKIQRGPSYCLGFLPLKDRSGFGFYITNQPFYCSTYMTAVRRPFSKALFGCLWLKCDADGPPLSLGPS